MLDLQCMVQDELDNLWQKLYKKIENIVDKITYETIVKYVKPVSRLIQIHSNCHCQTSGRKTGLENTFGINQGNYYRRSSVLL
jgi:hypothetical protein